MKKLGLAVCYKLNNYGTVLQAFATQRFLFKLGFDNECVNYCKKKSFRVIFSYLHTLLIPFVLKMKLEAIKKKYKEKTLPVEMQNKFEKRRMYFAKFIENKFVTTSPIYSYKELQKKSNDYSALLVGSDQIWHPLNLGSHFYTLEWGFENQRRIAYAPSFGVSKIPFIQKRKYVHFLSKFSAISCREKRGVEIVKKLTGRCAQLVLDPTLLYSAKEWEQELGNPKRLIEKKYIFCYFLGNNPKQRMFAENLKRQTGCQIVFLPHLDEIIASDEEFGDIQLFDVGPAEFFSLIRDAEYVCTDSFHGTVFSILNKKSFATFNRYKQTKGSTNSRIDSLLSILELENRHLMDDDSITKIFASVIDYDVVLEKLSEYREKSIKFLTDALKGIENA